MFFFRPHVYPNLTMNCTHSNDKTDIGYIRCSLMWMWNIVNFCSTCHHLALTLEIAIGVLTDEHNTNIPFTLFGGHRYISTRLLIGEYTTFEDGMRKARKLLKRKTATYFGLSGLAAFLRENEATHDSDVSTVINYGRIHQKQSAHANQFKVCGDYVNNLEEVNSDIADIMRGMTIPGSGVVVKYVCVDDLASAIADAIRACEQHVTECKRDGNFPNDFNPDDHRSVRAAIDRIVDLAEE
jgi:hypothetical protein